jgi:hypothetical protein
MICTRCNGTGFLNLHQVDDATLKRFDEDQDHALILAWIIKTDQDHDVEICDCCGDGHYWYGSPGEHYGNMDPQGPTGPYASNGGLCKCH